MTTLNEAIKRYTDNAEYERTHGNLQGYLEFKQLADWLKDYERLLKQELKQEPKSDINKIRAEIIDMRSKQNCSCLDCLDIIDKYRKPKFNVGTVGIISHGRRTLADLAADLVAESEDKDALYSR